MEQTNLVNADTSITVNPKPRVKIYVRRVALWTCLVLSIIIAVSLTLLSAWRFDPQMMTPAFHFGLHGGLFFWIIIVHPNDLHRVDLLGFGVAAIELAHWISAMLVGVDNSWWYLAATSPFLVAAFFFAIKTAGNRYYDAALLVSLSVIGIGIPTRFPGLVIIELSSRLMGSAFERLCPSKSEKQSGAPSAPVDPRSVSNGSDGVNVAAEP